MTADQPTSPEPARQHQGGPALAGSGSTGWSDSASPIPMPTSGLGSQPVHEAGSALSSSSAASAPQRATPARAAFEAGELAIVCSRYDIGIIESIKEFRRGSGKAPKVVLKTDRGRYLLKRRAAGKETPARVAFSHAIQLHLAQRRFPLPRLIATRTDGGSMLLLEQNIYELFEFVAGNGYDGSLDATADAGRALGFFHRLLGSFKTSGYTPPTASYHGARGLTEHLGAIAARMTDPADAGVAGRLAEAYSAAARRVDDLGFGSWPSQIIHGDWHPGNMLFRGSRVAAVIDYDTARCCPRVVDLANGALQFSITMKGHDPDRWPEGLDESRLRRFCRGYESVKDCVISTAELEALPWLMTEALIVEAAIPIAATGSFAGLSGAAFLRMVDAKCRWLERHAGRVTSLLGE